MIHSNRRQNRQRRADERQARSRHALLLILAMLPIFLSGPGAHAADIRPAGFRAAKAVEQFDDVWQFAATYELRPPRRLRARHLELAVGALSSPADTRPFVSLGPVWEIPSRSRALFLELGFSVTLLGGSTFDGQDLGGNFHFTSSAAVGTRFGRQRAFALSLRFQHTSNGGLNSTNPGLDAVALNFTFDLPNR